MYIGMLNMCITTRYLVPGTPSFQVAGTLVPDTKDAVYGSGIYSLIIIIGYLVPGTPKTDCLLYWCFFKYNHQFYAQNSTHKNLTICICNNGTFIVDKQR